MRAHPSISSDRMRRAADAFVVRLQPLLNRENGYFLRTERLYGPEESISYVYVRRDGLAEFRGPGMLMDVCVTRLGAVYGVGWWHSTLKRIADLPTKPPQQALEDFFAAKGFGPAGGSSFLVKTSRLRYPCWLQDSREAYAQPVWEISYIRDLIDGPDEEQHYCYAFVEALAEEAYDRSRVDPPPKNRR